ncbi:hypothetical protein QWY82_18220 [Simiduia curdlanivorans]|uniref:Uncharacterized protein n=1 Tax=Simiduia curdlanivorans TaxID=1492769 RepID=A0ABV8V6C8_9GAMM|nr:hypothetical protein [Simiduia curdlanivorans]MDN3640740.1 hypothetical protein [Simiduia curdlanivorans]
MAVHIFAMTTNLLNSRICEQGQGQDTMNPYGLIKWSDYVSAKIFLQQF